MSEPWRPHATVAAVVERDGRLLLVEETIAGRRVFNQPAGHVEHGEDLLQAVRREVLEETGRSFTPRHVVGIYLLQAPVGKTSYLRVCFSGEVGEAQPGRALDEGIIATHWLDPGEIDALGERLRSPVVQRCIQDFLAGAAYPLSLCQTFMS